MNPHDDQKLERLVQQTLRDLPPRRAPRTLEARVLAELQRRAVLPWWRKSFVHWPLAARAVFLLITVALVKVGFMGAVWVMAGFDVAQYREAFATNFAWMDASFAVLQTFADLGSAVIRRIPMLWLYGGAAFVAALYVAFFGLGAAVYRTLYASR